MSDQQSTALEEAQATNRGLIRLLGEQARTIGFTQNRLEWASADHRQKAMERAADFLAAYFGPVSDDGLSCWSDEEARKVHHGLVVALAQPNRPEEAELAREVQNAITQ